MKYLSKSSLTVAVEPISYSCDCTRRTAISMVVKRNRQEIGFTFWPNVTIWKNVYDVLSQDKEVKI